MALARWMPPRPSCGSGWDGPPKSVLLAIQMIRIHRKGDDLHIQSEELHEPEFWSRSLIAQEGANIVYPVVDTRHQC
jgi:hypothetical protein